MLCLRLYICCAYIGILMSCSLGFAQPATSIPSVAQTLPKARRIFSVHLDDDGQHEILMANHQSLTAWKMNPTGAQKLWEIEGPGVAHLVQVADLGQGKELLVAWGMGRGQMGAAITLQSHHRQTGVGRLLWSYKGARNQPVSLQVLQADQDQAQEILMGYFISKYHSQAILLDIDPALKNSTPKATTTTQVSQKTTQAADVKIKTFPLIRMGTSWFMGEMDDHSGLDRVIGRVYGDEKGEYGDLIVSTSDHHRIVIPSERGVKGIWQLPIQSKTPRKELYISDGWVASYGKKAKARLKRLSWQSGRPHVELLLNQNQEFTFFNLWVEEDQKHGRLLWVRGNKFLSLIEPKNEGMWKLHPIQRLPPVVNIAVGQYQGRWYVCVPTDKETQVYDLQLPHWVSAQ